MIEEKPKEEQPEVQNEEPAVPQNQQPAEEQLATEDPKIPGRKGIILETDHCPGCKRNLFFMKKKIALHAAGLCICPECGCVFLPKIMLEAVLKQMESAIIAPGSGPMGTISGFPGGRKTGKG